MNNKKHMEDILYYFEKYHYENMILDDNEAKFIHDYIINLQSKIDKANEILNKRYEEDKEIFKGDYDFKFILDFEEELLDILKEDK